MLTIYYKNESQRLKQLKILEKQKNYKKDNKQQKVEEEKKQEQNE